MNRKKFIRGTFLITDIIAFMIILLGIWKIDLVISFINTGTVATNGFSNFSYAELYHISLWGIMGSTVYLFGRILLLELNKDYI